MPKYPVKTLIAIHSYLNRNRIERAIEHGDKCCCFSCGMVFFGEDITEWEDGGATALCPFCKQSTVLPYVLPKNALEKGK